MEAARRFAKQPSDNLSAHEIQQLKRVADSIRLLTIDAVQKANSGHPGMPLGMADVATVLWLRHLKHAPSAPDWPNRDRFVLSAGHGSMLLYSLLYLTGYDVSLEDLRQFRQLDSKTPGHPEYGHTPGVEITTGPLGQGIASAVGMALGEQILRETYNRPDFPVVDHFTYVLASDGDLMEGISHEAASLAGHLGLGKLIVLYDDNHISIDGSTDLAFSERVTDRFGAYGWQVLEADGHDVQSVDTAIRQAKHNTTQPTLIACRTVIGYGSPHRAGTAKVHGEPLGEEEWRLTRATLGFADADWFQIPEEALKIARQSALRGTEAYQQWQQLVDRFRQTYPDVATELFQRLENRLPAKWDTFRPEFDASKPLATRAASGKVLEKLTAAIPQLIGGSADLSGSNKTLTAHHTIVQRENPAGNYIHYGVREHAMGAIMNGLALHGGFIPYGGTFLVFSDYMRPAIRLAAMMKLQVVYVFTHDSIGLGEDGPTHQPVEHLAALRAIPNLTVIRPADAAETFEAWRVALQNTTGPTAIVLTRQGVPHITRPLQGANSAEKLERGAYILRNAEKPRALILASGSEVAIALEAHQQLLAERIQTKVISVPSVELFLRQPQHYQDLILPGYLKARVAVEAGIPDPWFRLVGDAGEIIGMTTFGASAPYKQLYQKFNITPQAVVDAVKTALRKAKA